MKNHPYVPKTKLEQFYHFDSHIKLILKPEIYDPVCGEDGKIYNNPCVAKCDSVKVISKGKCPWLCGPCVSKSKSLKRTP